MEHGKRGPHLRPAHRQVRDADDILLLRGRCRAASQRRLLRPHPGQQDQPRRVSQVSLRAVRRDERRRQLPHAGCPALQRRTLRRCLRAPSHSRPDRHVRAAERPRLVGHRTLHLRNPLRAGHRREQAQAARHALHIQRRHRANHRACADETAARRMGGHQDESQAVSRLDEPTGRRPRLPARTPPRHPLRVPSAGWPV